MKQISGALDEVSLWFGRVDDIINECKMINKLNDKISVLFDAVQIQGNLPTIHVVVSDIVIKIAIDVKTYPFANLNYSFDKNLTNKQQAIIEEAIVQFRPPAYTYGRLESFFSFIANSV